MGAVVPYKDYEKQKANSRARHHRRMETEPEKVREETNVKQRRQRKERPEHYRAKSRRHNNARYHRRMETEPEVLRLEQYKYRLKVRYKVNGQPMTLEDYDAFSDKQGGHCALCARTHEQERYGRLSVDHDYETGEVRGLLCASCNTSLGHFGDSEAGVLRLLAYVRGDL